MGELTGYVRTVDADFGEQAVFFLTGENKVGRPLQPCSVLSVARGVAVGHEGHEAQTRYRRLAGRERWEGAVLLLLRRHPGKGTFYGRIDSLPFVGREY